MAHEAQVRYSSLVDAKLRSDLKILNVFNKKYEGNPTSGSVKIPVRDGEVVVGDYNKATGGAPTQGSTTYKTLVIDQDKFVNELIDGFDAAAVPDALVADRLDSAAYSLGVTIDSYLVGKLVELGTTDEDTAALTKSNIYDKIVDTRTKIRDSKVPMEGCTLIVAPATYALLLKSPEYIKSGDLSQSMVEAGYVGMIAGFPVMETNNMPEGVDYIVANSTWCTFVDEWAVPVKVVDLDGDANFVGASAVKGRKIYAATVTKAAAVIVKKHTA